MNTNRDLVNDYKIRCTNHEELLKNVKLLNQVVQRAGNLRGIYILIVHFNSFFYKFLLMKAGRYKTDVVANCRTAIKQNNSVSLVKIIKTGIP